MKKAVSFMLTSALLLGLSLTAHAEYNTTLRYGSDGTFTILQITDPQDDAHPSPDMLKLISLAIEESDPDLVVFSGDIVEDIRVGDVGTDDEAGREGVCVYDLKGNIQHDETVENVRTACAAIFSEVESKGIPFAVALGNNDYQSGLSTDDWLNVFDDYRMSLTADESDDEDDRLDCSLEILSSSSEDTAFVVWLMDTKKEAVTDDQIDWFNDTADDFKNDNNGVDVPSVVFQHIPVDDVGNLFERCHIWDADAMASGLKFYRLNKNIANGYYTSTWTPGKTTDEFEAWKDNGVLGAYFGHLHTEGYSGIVNGVDLGFTYGCQIAKNGPYGVRVITLNETDPGSYDNALYVYEGSVADGDARLVKQVNVPYPVYDGFFDSLGGFFKNTFVNLWHAFIGIF